MSPSDSPSSTHPDRHIALLPGDGIGPEITNACLPVLTAAFPHWRITAHGIGWSHWCADGDPVPAETWDAVTAADATLMVAITSKPAATAEAELAEDLRGTGLVYRSPILQLRKSLDLFANIRPVTLPGGHRITVVRENTEGLYSHDVRGSDLGGVYDHIAEDPTVRETLKDGSLNDVAVSLRVSTLHGWRRLLRSAAEIAIREGLDSVTVADKPNVLQASGDIVVRAIEQVSAEHPQVTFELANIDVVAMNLVTGPERYGIIAAENVFGDILSDITAGLGGGLGVVAAANVGKRGALFEPVHGSAPDIAGTGTADPTAFLRAAIMCAEHLGAPADLAGAQLLTDALDRTKHSFTGSTAFFAETIGESLQQKG